MHRYFKLNDFEAIKRKYFNNIQSRVYKRKYLYHDKLPKTIVVTIIIVNFD